MPLPVLMSSEAERDQMLKIGPVAKVHALGGKADLRLVGIGQMDKNAQFHVDGFICREELLELMRLGAVGEMTGWAFDAAGRFIKGEHQSAGHQRACIRHRPAMLDRRRRRSARRKFRRSAPRSGAGSSTA